MKCNPHLSFDGDCQAAFQFYERCLGGRIETMLTYGDSPMAAQWPAELAGKIMHATLAAGELMLTGADVSAGQYEKPRGFSILLEIEESSAAERVFNALSENGKVQMQLQETFWARGFGMVTDQYGIPWMINSR